VASSRRKSDPKPSTAPSTDSAGELDALLDAAVDAIIVIDERGHIEKFSRAAERMFGYTEREILGQNISKLMPGDYRSRHDDYLDRYRSTGEARIIGVGREAHASRKDGSVFPCELAVGRVSDPTHQRFVGIVRDISARKAAAEKLRRSEAALQLAQQVAGIGNYVVHLDGSEPDYYSPQILAMLNLKPDAEPVSPEEYLNHWVHQGDVARLRSALRSVNTGSDSFDIEYRVILLDGSIRHLHHLVQVLRDESGKAIKHVGTVHDVTDRRRAEDEARQMQDRLTHFSRLSTMGEMAAGLAHEINQPLTAIATYAQASQRLLGQPDHDDADIAAALEQINAQALRAGEVIRRLRAFVKNREVKREPIDCARLLDDLSTLAETDARLHNVQLRIEVGEKLPLVHADPIQLQQVILNLVRNAIDAMLGIVDGEREVVLAARLTPQGEVEFSVADRGPGLAPGAVEHIFNPFFTTKATGTGLGLAISRSIVRAHAGRLWHTPNAGSGLIFHFTLPVNPASQGRSEE